MLRNNRKHEDSVRILRIETKLSKLMQYLNVPVQEHDSKDLLSGAYELLCEFEAHINESIDGDHHSSDALGAWLNQYEKLKGIEAAQ